jgi:hypothetical protein
MLTGDENPAVPTGNGNVMMAHARQLLRQSPYWPRAQDVGDGETGDNCVKRPVDRKVNVTMGQAMEILRKSPYYTGLEGTSQVDRRQEVYHGETIFESTSLRQGDLEEASNKLDFWEANYKNDKEELHAYRNGYKPAEMATVIGYWVIEMQVTDTELKRYGRPSGNSHAGRLSCGHHHGLHAAMRGSALVQIHPNQGHVTVEARVSENGRDMRDSTTYHAHRELLEQDQDRHRWVEGRIKQGQPDGHGSHPDRDMGSSGVMPRGDVEGPKAQGPRAQGKHPFLV